MRARIESGSTLTRNLDGIITGWIKSPERLFGYAAEEIVAKIVVILTPPGREDEEPQILDRMFFRRQVDYAFRCLSDLGRAAQWIKQNNTVANQKP